MRIAIHEPRPLRETLLLTSFRVVLGALLGLRALLRLEPHGGIGALTQPGFWSSWFAEFSLSAAGTTDVLWAGALGISGLGLIVGLLSRVSAWVAAASALTGLISGPWSLEHWAIPEGGLLFLTASLVIAGIGPGDWSLDHILRERARRRAIQQDELWLQPPYVPAEDHGRDSRWR